MAKTNFQFERRQKDLEKKRKKEEKVKRKADKKDQPGEEGDAVEGSTAEQSSETDEGATEAAKPGDTDPA